MNDSVLHTSSPNFNSLRNGPIYPITPAKVGNGAQEQPANLKQTVIETLLNGPVRIAEAQTAFDKADRAYKALLTATSIRGLGKTLFPGKDGLFRAASNDTERALAIDDAVMSSPELIRLAEKREATLTALRLARDTFEAAKLIVGLLNNA